MNDPKKKADAKTPAIPKDMRPPAQSLLDEERGDWEGMGQSRHQPETSPDGEKQV
jgi:hypothetical protein